MRIGKALVTVTTTALFAMSVAACGGDSGPDDNKIKVAYQRYGSGVQIEQHMQRTKTAFEQANPGVTVELVPVISPENEYLSKIQLMLRSASTAPDVFYEDSFNVNADVDAGYLAPLDDYLAKWEEWSQFNETAKQAGRAVDGKTYAVPMGTDTRGLWYNTEIFAKAGLPAQWEPKTWDDILAAARTIKAKVPDVIPFNMAAGKPAGEGASMQSMEMLLYGTKTGTLFDLEQKKWVAPSEGMTDSLRFVREVFGGGLGPTPAQVADPQYYSQLIHSLTRDGKVAIRLDGSWLPQHWLPSGKAEWPRWPEVMSYAPMPTQHGQDPGKVSLSGGWTLAVSEQSRNKDTAFKFITVALNKEGSLILNKETADIPVREDVAADPRIAEQNPTVRFWSGLIDVTHFRPTLPVYPRVSEEIQVAMEQVVNGADPVEVAKNWAEKVRQVVGADNTRAG